MRALLPTCFHMFPLVSDMFPTLLEKTGSVYCQAGACFAWPGWGKWRRGTVADMFPSVPACFRSVSDAAVTKRGSVWGVARAGEAAQGRCCRVVSMCFRSAWASISLHAHLVPTCFTPVFAGLPSQSLLPGSSDLRTRACFQRATSATASQTG